jgi:hypothetical protein
MRSLPLLAVLLAVAATSAAAQTVRGRVVDASNGRPVAQALVTATDRNPRDGGCAPRIFLDGVLLGEGLAVLDRSLRGWRWTR